MLSSHRRHSGFGASATFSYFSDSYLCYLRFVFSLSSVPRDPEGPLPSTLKGLGTRTLPVQDSEGALQASEEKGGIRRVVFFVLFVSFVNFVFILIRGLELYQIDFG